MHSRHMLTDAFGLVAAPGRPGDRLASPPPNMHDIVQYASQQLVTLSDILPETVGRNDQVHPPHVLPNILRH